MNPAHLHLLLNHFPILGSLFGFCLLAYGLLFRNRPVERAGLVTLAIITLIAIPVVLSGEEAEEMLEGMAGLSDYHLEKHEDLAEPAFWCMVATGIMSLLALILSLTGKIRNRLPSHIVLLLAAATFSLMAQVALLGGKIRHSEIRSGTVAQPHDD